ncbi:glycosyltransferase family 2 protein [Prauserella muralis]|uniref:glycosyltransferase family 2 protein n=1 Tax=Prauserella muralis TaxID=588067 RepID=UPI000DD4DA60|nr:glycosyltransferase family 2 protein [Prauserella muralis]TWE14787.1 glycosyltransferase involved in cell wall biosynthesis [Prauserella muralis]
MTGLLRRHWLLLVLLAGGITLRVLTWLAYQPALLYIDTFRYLSNLEQLRPTDLNPLGYTVVLKGLLGLGDLAFVAAVQHAVGVLMALALYALALRYTNRTWLAAIVTAPVLLDAYQLQIEENIMSEVLFQVLLVGFLWALLARREPRWWGAAAAGVLLAFAIVTRTIGITLVVPLMLHLVFAGSAWRSWAGWRRIGVRVLAGVAGLAVVLVSYAGYFKSQAGHWGLTGAQTSVLYGRASVVADCSQLPQDDEVLLRFCPTEPLDQRKGIDFYTHFQYGDPNWPPGELPPGRTKSELANEFAKTVMLTQPVDFTLAILRDFAKNFAPIKETLPNDVPVERWQFQTTYPYYNIGEDSVERLNAVALYYDGMLPATNTELAAFLRDYQLNGGYTWGPALGIFALLGLLGAAGVGKARRSGLQGAAFLATASGGIILLGSAAFEFSWRYQLPALVLLPLGGVLGLAAMLGWAKRKPGSTGRRPKMADFPDDTDAQAVADFRKRYGDSPLTPLVVVIAAYNEAEGIGAVLREMPTHCGDLPVSTLVVVDGATDDTAEVAERNGAYVCVAQQNRGQGGALRLGYHLAALCGARYIVTTDADGQYDNGEMQMLVKPLLDGSADFVTGSRRLGSGEYDSSMRWLGVRVFAWLATILTMRKITDTSFGFRAMPAELATSVTLREPQYQSSELLLGVMARGARVLEVPMSMRLRNNGKSKKGRSLKYGANYGRVMTGTWLREYVLRGGRHRQTPSKALVPADDAARPAEGDGSAGSRAVNPQA